MINTTKGAARGDNEDDIGEDVANLLRLLQCVELETDKRTPRTAHPHFLFFFPIDNDDDHEFSK